MKKKNLKTFHSVRERLARNLAQHRTDQGLTFEDLGNQSGLHWRHVQKIEAGEGNITLLTLCRLSDGLSMDAKDLLVQPGKVSDG